MKLKFILIFLVFALALAEFSSATSGGIVTCIPGNYTIRTFISNGTLNVTGTLSLKVLVVAGGGAGGYDSAGGGGAGGLVYNDSFTASGIYNVVVGSGGIAGGLGASTSGTDSSFDGMTAKGGGVGADYRHAGTAGGSGGGGSGDGTYAGGASTQTNSNGTGHGYAGGIRSGSFFSGAGGGGAGAIGGTGGIPSGWNSGAGGDGLTYSTSGFDESYSGGGGGGRLGALGGLGGGGTGGNLAANNSATYYGGGGGGGAQLASGGNGYRGIVIVRYDSGSTVCNATYLSQLSITILNVLNESPITDNVTVTIQMSDGSNFQSNTTTTGTAFFLAVVPGTYVVSLSSPNYWPVSYQLTIPQYTLVNNTAYLTARLVPLASGINITMVTQNNMNQIVPGARILVAKHINGTYQTISDTITDSVGASEIYVEPSVAYLVTITASGFLQLQFLHTFSSAVNPDVFILQRPAGPMTTTNIFDDVTFYYSPTQINLNQSAAQSFFLSATSASSQLVSISIDSTLGNNSVFGSPASAVVGITVDLSSYNGTYPVQYCINQASNPVYCFTVNYWVGPVPASNSIGVWLDTVKSNFTGTDGAGWLTLIATLIVLMLCFTVSRLGNPTVTTITGFIGMIVFAVIGWVSPIIVGFISVVGLMMFFLRRGGY